ncbi:hypothetical protein GJAV_G00102210 [Gymnothorax javanicus]|nr:hypothetical protein GJAV_G00102210 [Gymnothorax javanicus]
MGGRQHRGGAGRPMDMCRGREERWGDGKANRLNQEMMMDRTVKGQMGKSSNETVRMTSFNEMGRRQEGNGCSSRPSSSRDCETNGDTGTDSYYTITTNKAHNPNTNIHLNNNDSYPQSTAGPDSRSLPPPPPPLLQPPAPPRANLRSFPVDKCRPERLDWLIEFSPDTDTLSKPSAQSREEETSSQKFTSGAKVTTFKELRRQSKLNPTPATIYKEPEPTAITPDPDFLYSQKWTSESIEGDDRLWIYSAQAQTILQPPPVTPLAPLKEMLPLGRGEPVSHPFPLIGCSVCEHRLQTAAEEKEEARVAVRGRADGGMTEDSSTTDCRLSFAESVQRGGALTADGVRTQLGSQGLFSKCLQEKRALLSPISLAVDAILAQFNSSRTQVQKVQSGDSRPYQTDLITGRRPNSAWGLVQACIGPGPSTQAMYRLQCEISQLPQLKQSRHRFNAFLLGLLNIKLLDHWVFHLQSCDDVLETHYQPTSFMRLSRTSCQPLFEELLLLLQPLSLLTFNLDLLFQHHHFDPASPIPSPANYAQEDCSPAYQACSLGIRGLSCWRRGQSSKQATGTLEDKQRRKPAALAGNSSNMGLNGTANHHQGPGVVSANKGEVSNHVLWMEREVAPSGVDSLSQQAGQVTQPGWGSLVQWGRKLGQSWGSYYKTKLGVPSLEYDYITHKAQQNTVPECNSPTPWVLGMLFGASRGQKGPQGCTTSARRPSQWLAPGASLLSQIVAPAQNPEPRERAGQSEWEKERDRVGERDHPRLVRPVRMQREHRPRGQLY